MRRRPRWEPDGLGPREARRVRKHWAARRGFHLLIDPHQSGILLLAVPYSPLSADPAPRSTAPMRPSSHLARNVIVAHPRTVHLTEHRHVVARGRSQRRILPSNESGPRSPYVDTRAFNRPTEGVRDLR